MFPSKQDLTFLANCLQEEYSLIVVKTNIHIVAKKNIHLL